jgi:Protein of unknown function (DUF3108)
MLSVRLFAKAAAAVLASSLLAGLPQAAAAAPKAGAAASPGRVRANYVITFNGIELGNFVWDSAFKDGTYKLSSNAKLSALFGAYTWQGVTRSMGTFGGGTVSPSAYGFKFQATDKNGQVDMRFAKGSVTELKTLPVDNGSIERVPLTRAHMANVLDPLSAVMAMSTPTGGKIGAASPCQKRVPVFDGKQRFDLQLSFLRKAPVNAAGATFAYVCRVRYVPIAGHKNNSETKFMVDNKDIEIWLAPVEYANIYVPTAIVIPTWAGQVQIATSKVQIDMGPSTLASQ